MNSNPKMAISQDVERKIVQYLQQHPDFFARHTALLTELYIPHQTGDAISLVERQITAMREQKQQAQKKIKEFITNAEENERLSYVFQKLAIDLLETQSWQAVFESANKLLSEQLGVDEVTLRFLPHFKNSAIENDYYLPENAPESRFLQVFSDQQKPFCGQLELDQRILFFKEKAEKIASFALIPLQTKPEDPSFALLLLGSYDTRRFTPLHDTLFLTHIGAIISAALMRFLKKD